MSSVGKIRRLLQIVEYLQSGRKYHTGQLSEFLNVSKRTIFRDLKVLQESGVQLLYDEVEQGYWVPPNTYLPPTDLTINETLALLVLGEKLGRTEGIPFQAAARDASMKLMANLPNSIRGMLSDLTDRLQIRLESRHPLNHANEHYDRLIQAIETRCKIRLQYDSLYEQRTISTLVSPYEMVFQKRSWYVIGRSSLHRDTRTFHVGRITASELTKDDYEIPPRFSLKRFFGNAWRMIREEPEVEVIVRFKPLVARNVAEVIWHRTQKLVWNDDGSLNYHVQVEGIREISWWILGYGDQAEVLAPPSLRDLIVSHVDRMHAVYRPESASTTPSKSSVPKRKATKKSAEPRQPKR